MGTYAPAVKLNSRNPQHDDWYPRDQVAFIQAGIPGLMIAENNANEIWYQGSNKYYHTLNDASDRLANNPNNGSGIVYEYGFATDVVRGAVGMLAAQAGVVPEPTAIAGLASGLAALAARRRRRR